MLLVCFLVIIGISAGSTFFWNFWTSCENYIFFSFTVHRIHTTNFLILFIYKGHFYSPFTVQGPLQRFSTLNKIYHPIFCLGYMENGNRAVAVSNCEYLRSVLCVFCVFVRVVCALYRSDELSPFQLIFIVRS